MIDWILQRRSIRQFQNKDIPEDRVTDLLKAAMAAPTANNVQDWEFLVVRSPEQRKALAEAHPYGKMCAQAPVVIVVIGDPTMKYMDQHCAAATQNILLAAASMGLGSVWLGMKDPERISGVTRVTGIPEGRLPVVMIPIGYPAEEKAPRTQYDPNKVWREQYGKR